MKHFTFLLSWIGLGALLWFGSGCGPKAFTKGDYDDPDRVNLLNDQFSESDLQRMADRVIKEMTNCATIAQATKRPVVIMGKVGNRTEEHIDTVSLTDKIRTGLIQSGKMRFVNKEARGTLNEEYDYSAGGNVSSGSMKKRGKQIGADYLLDGNISTVVQEVGNDKTVYYKFTMNLTGIEDAMISCVSEMQERKKYRKQSVGL